MRMIGDAEWRCWKPFLEKMSFSLHVGLLRVDHCCRCVGLDVRDGLVEDELERMMIGDAKMSHPHRL